MRDTALRAGMLRHRPYVWSADRWGASYADGTLDYFASPRELARYSMIVGYVDAIGGAALDSPGGGPIHVLDVGCGQGVLRRHLRVDGAWIASYTGADPTSTAIEAAQGLADARTRFVVGTGGSVEGAFDVVVCNEVLYVVEEPERLVDDLYERVRPGGHLITSMWRHPGDRRLWTMIDARFERVDAVVVRNEANDLAPRGWRVANHRRAADHR